MAASWDKRAKIIVGFVGHGFVVGTTAEPEFKRQRA
jgi:hypothetical protein